MRKIAPVALLVAGCSATPPAIADCEQELLNTLRSPSSYELIEADEVALTEQTGPLHQVILQYDAQNGFGATVRDMHVCRYAIVNGKPDLTERIPLI